MVAQHNNCIPEQFLNSNSRAAWLGVATAIPYSPVLFPYSLNRCTGASRLIRKRKNKWKSFDLGEFRIKCEDKHRRDWKFSPWFFFSQPGIRIMHIRIKRDLTCVSLLCHAGDVTAIEAAYSKITGVKRVRRGPGVHPAVLTYDCSREVLIRAGRPDQWEARTHGPCTERACSDSQGL